MCLAIPMRIEAVDGYLARCQAKGVWRDVSLFMMQDEMPSIGDFTPPSNFGLYVEMNDRYSNAEAYPAVSKKSKYKFSQRLYIFDSAEPITVTATVIVFGVGELATSDCGYKEYRISIINEQGQDVVRPNALSGSRQCILGIGVDHETPQIQTFRIDDVANLSSGGAFTMTLARRVWVGEERYLLEGNPVRFRVRTP